MPKAKADETVLAYLGRALSLELSAVQLYSTQACLVATWGLTEAATRFRKESDEELQHANRIIQCMLADGFAPGASQLRPVSLAGDLPALLTINMQFESELIDLYQQASAHCRRIGDQAHLTFFQALLEDENFHQEELSNWLASLATVSTVAGLHSSS